MFSQILAEFLFRLTFGVAVAMGATSSRLVTSGFFRVHLWMLMGMQTAAALALRSSGTSGSPLATRQFWLAVAGAVTSYVASVVWMYERRAVGKTLIGIVATLALAGCILPLLSAASKPTLMQIADRITGGLLLGLVTTAMLLGHWYLNTPTMKLAPLKRLLLLLGIAILLRMATSGTGGWLAATHSSISMPREVWFSFIALRWLSGLVGLAVLTWLTWQTLKIPNTQSATGILYAGVVLAFAGELTSQLLSAESLYPV